MPIRRDGYETSAGSVINTGPITSKIKESIIKDELNKVTLGVHSSGSVKPLFITGALPGDEQIPLFTHPILIKNFQNTDYLCTDIRLVVSKGANLEDFASYVRDKPTYSLYKSRAILNLSWLNNGPDSLKTGFDLASAVFSQWVSQTLAGKYGLDHSDKATIAVVSSYYYQMFFTEKTTPDEDDLQKMAVHTIKTTGVDAARVFELFANIGEITSFIDLPEKILKNVNSRRMEGMNAAAMLNLFKSSWYGTDASEFIRCAFEHPPTWIALVYAAVSDRTYKTSIIARTADVLAKRGRGDEFVAAYKAMMAESVSLEEAAVKPAELSAEDIIATLGEFK